MENMTPIARIRQDIASGKLPSPDPKAVPVKMTPHTKETAKQSMKLARAKDLFEFGILTKAEIVDNPMGSGWLLQLTGRSGELHTIETDRGQTRVFKTLDAAFKLCEEIGFETAIVNRKRAMLHR